MSPKKSARVSRWRPLPDNAIIMQTMNIPEMDEFPFRPEDLSTEDLINCNKYTEQSNKTIETENSVIERYLVRMDPSSLDKMTQILEAAAIALQKAERTAHLGGGAGTHSTGSISKEVFSGKMIDDSISSSSRGGTSKSAIARGPKLTFFGLPDKIQKVQNAQKIEIVNRETEELKSALESFRKKARNFNYILRCRNEEMSERLQEIIEAQNNFEQKLMIEGLDPITGKLPGEKFIRYQEMRLKTQEIEIDRMRIKTGTLKMQLKKVKQQLQQKEELGEILRAVDFEQLQIENRDCQERLDKKVLHLIDVKTSNGKFGNLLNTNKKKLQELMNRLVELEETVVFREKMIKELREDEEKINEEVNAAAKAVAKISNLMKSYTVPDLMDYIEKKAEIHDLNKEIKVVSRQVKLKDLALASRSQRLKNLNEGLNKSENLDTKSTSSF